MRNSRLEKELTNILQGFRRIRKLSIPDFCVVCEGGACWGRTIIYLKDRNYSEETKTYHENKIRNILKEPDEIVEDWPNSTAIEYFYVHHVENLEDYKYKYFKL